jgi:RIO kinase 1
VPDPSFRRKNRFDDEEPLFARRQQRRSLAAEDLYDAVDGLPAGERWSTWDQPAAGDRGPEPYPRWLVTELAAVDTELGVLKTGKEADVFLVRRGVPPSGPSCLLAAKRYRDPEHRMFHRDSSYREGRRVRQSRDNRAMASGSAVGRQMIAAQWAGAEFAALSQLHQAGVPVPYPVQLLGTEVMLEFIGDADGTAAPRLAETRPGADELVLLWGQLVGALSTLARLGLAHGDLSAYNLLVHRGRLVMIDLPQVVDVISHPNGAEFLDRDATNVARWFTARGLSADVVRSAGPVLPADAVRGAGVAHGAGGGSVPSGVSDGRPGDGRLGGGSVTGEADRGWTAGRWSGGESVAEGAGHGWPGDGQLGGSWADDGRADVTGGGRPGDGQIGEGRPGNGRSGAGRRGGQVNGRPGNDPQGPRPGEPGRPDGGAGRADPVPGYWAGIPAPEDLAHFLRQEALLA